MHARARWAVPAVVAAVVAGGAALGPSVASAAPDLAPTTPAKLLADVAGAPPQALSGTVELTTDLGLPELPSAGTGGASGGGSEGAGSTESLTALMGGTTTARVWSDGHERSRVSVVDGLSETTLVRSGRDVWTWRSGASSQRSTTHTELPDGTAGSTAGTATGPAPGSPALPGDLSPQEAADRVLAAVDDDTAVSLDGTASVAGRDAHLLVLEPRTRDTLVGRVVLAVDAETSTPLRVQVFARGAKAPAVSVGFSDVDFGEPAAADLTPAVPGDAPVRELEAPAGGQVGTAGGSGPSQTPDPQVVGSGWTAVAVLTGLDGAGASPDGSPGASSGAGTTPQGAAGQLPSALAAVTTPVSGAFGSGWVLSTPLLSVLVTDDGRVLAGAVPASALETAAASR